MKIVLLKILPFLKVEDIAYKNKWTLMGRPGSGVVS